MDRNFFDGRVVLSLDPGRRYLVAGALIVDWQLKTSVRISSRYWYRADGTDEVGLFRVVRAFLIVTFVVWQAERKGRVRAAAGCAGHDPVLDAWEEQQRCLGERRGAPLHTPPNFAASQRYRADVHKEHRRKAKQRVNQEQRQLRILRELCDTIDGLFAAHLPPGSTKQPVILVGEAGRGNCWRGIGGSRGGGAQRVINFLAEHFFLITVPEEYTSQRCPRCHGQSEQGTMYEKRTKCCEHCAKGGRPFFFDRDLAASVNFYYIAVFMAKAFVQGKKAPRPRAFCRPKKTD